ncbi:G-protein coupled receptor Mth2 isoform X4 [Leptinotarsa decemlineata]|uniref:G-protein coupled receptor Mth2 isoform X4 n=1 Tax=Leptinotarsa decemlineata TaxID=7539 RepID=UPI003D30919E
MRVLTFCLLARQIFCQDLPCPVSLTIDISDGPVEGGFVKNGVMFHEGDYFKLNDTTLGCVCNILPCIRKCCPENESFDGTQCVESEKTFNITIYDGTTVSGRVKQGDFYLIRGDECSSEKHYRIGIYPNESAVLVQTNGSLLVQTFEVFYSPEDYCVEVVGTETIAFVCEVPESEVEARVLAYGMIISMPFLLATFLVYALLPEPNLHRRALMSYVATLLMGYILLVSVQLSSEGISDVSCNLLGYLIIFFFTVSFFWMNVMCIDMWLAFRGMRSFGDRKGAERKRFIIYCCYAWGMPLVDILIIFLLNTYGDQTSSYYPAIGIQRCFVGEGLPNFLYFYLLAMLILIINIVLFILTGFKIHKVQRETSVLKHSDSKRHAYEDDKQQYKLYVKLLFAMGVNWITEIISWAIGYFWQETPKAVFYFTDFINATYGVFIFFIFVFKRKIWTSLKKRYYICIGKPHLAHAMSTTRGGTRTSNFSTTETGTSVHTDYRMNEMRNGKPEERALNRH